jgi:thymidylate synthase (FAD)
MCHASAVQRREHVVNIIREPKVYLVGRQSADDAAIDSFLSEYGMAWQTDTEVGAEMLAEAAGRLCYLSYGKGRKDNRQYLDNIIESKHGSVLEHAVWNFIIAGVSRSFTHELVRHRAGFGFSQLSQRYVDESTANFIEPDVIAEDEALHAIWLRAVEASHRAYVELVEGLAAKYKDVPDRTQRRKLARQAARSVLPNATETMIFVTANGRALRHFIEMRASEWADVEIRKVAVQILRIMQKEAPSMFGDYAVVELADGTEVARTPHEKV